MIWLFTAAKVNVCAPGEIVIPPVPVFKPSIPVAVIFPPPKPPATFTVKAPANARAPKLDDTSKYPPHPVTDELLIVIPPKLTRPPLLNTRFTDPPSAVELDVSIPELLAKTIFSADTKFKSLPCVLIKPLRFKFPAVVVALSMPCVEITPKFKSGAELIINVVPTPEPLVITSAVV